VLGCDIIKDIEESSFTASTLETAFKAVGTMRGIGWVVLAYDTVGKKFFNLWINEHDVGHLVGTTPLLIMDVFEHAYMVDYVPTEKKNYIDGNAIIVDTKNSFIKGNKNKLIATIGLDNILVVDTDDALLICPKNRAQDVKKIVDELKKNKDKKYL